MSEESCRILITVTIYDGTKDETLQALREFQGTFNLRGGGEVEITAAELAAEP